VPFWSYASMRRDATPAGEVFYESSPLTFEGTASVQVFKNVQPVKIPQFEFVLNYRVFNITIVPPTVEKK
jgi:hypothetical protein